MKLAGKKLTAAVLAGLMSVAMVGGAQAANQINTVESSGLGSRASLSLHPDGRAVLEAVKGNSDKEQRGFFDASVTTATVGTTRGRDAAQNHGTLSTGVGSVTISAAQDGKTSKVKTTAAGGTEFSSAADSHGQTTTIKGGNIKTNEIDANSTITGGSVTSRTYLSADKGVVDRSTEDSTVVKKANTVGKNLNALDTAVASNKQAIEDAVNTQNQINGTLTTAVQNNSKAIVATAEAAQNLEKHLGETDGRVDKANQEIHTNAGNIAQNKLDIAANKDAIETEATVRAAADQALQEKIASNTQAIGTTNDGNYVKSDNSVGENLNALDAQVGQNSSNIDQLFNDYSSMKKDLNKVGARSAALAGLHAVDYDPANKLSFAVASGNFRNANSVAVGAFYRPNENIMFSAASTMGDSDNAYTFGVSFKLGPSTAKAKTAAPDTTELYKVIGQLQDQLAAQQKEIDQLKADKAK